MRLSGAPGSLEFLACVAAAEKLLHDRLAGRFDGLVRDYTLSPEFARLADSTRAEYKRLLLAAEREFSDLPIAALNDPRVRRDFIEWRDAVAAKSGAREADHRISAVSAMLTWGRDRALIDQNHLVGIKRLYRVDRSDAIWLPEQIGSFMKVAPVEMRRAMLLALHTGQRQADILRFAWSQYDGKALSIRQGKTGRRVAIPCTTALREMLDGLSRDAAVILVTKSGRPFKKRYFAAQWARASAAAGISGLHFHDLRGTAVTMLAEASCTVPEIATITGHSLKTVDLILERYLSRTRHLADAAISKLENASRTNSANQMQTGS